MSKHGNSPIQTRLFELCYYSDETGEEIRVEGRIAESESGRDVSAKVRRFTCSTELSELVDSADELARMIEIWRSQGFEGPSFEA